MPDRPQASVSGASASWFDYDTAFSRNIGWLTDAEQAILRGKRVAIAGMGGVGGIHMLTFARLGVGQFHVADMDSFELANFNRQAAASLRTLGQPKGASATILAREINPEIMVRNFDAGVNEDNLDAFLEGVDVYIDGLDFFVLDIRRKLFARARELGIPAITAGPLGFGTGYIIFTPDGMSFEDYFRMEGRSREQQYLSFLFGLTPLPKHIGYIADRARVDMAGKRGPSTGIACQLCAGVAAAQAVKLMLGRGKIWAAPYFHQFDPYLDIYKRGKLRWGNAGPLQRLKLSIVGGLIGHWGAKARPRDPDIAPDTPILERILQAARWAPSPDNCQPWRFEVLSDKSVRVHVDREADNPYQYRRSQTNLLAVGMLVEALALAASSHGWAMRWTWQGDNRLDVDFDPEAAIQTDPLVHHLKARTVDRRHYRRTPLQPAQRAVLEAALGDDFAVDWIERASDRMALARINAACLDVRLRSEACFAVHQTCIDWSTDYSRTGMPSKALGVDPLARRLMQWAMGNWARMKRMLALGAAYYSSLEMELLPAWQSAAFCLIRPVQPIASGDDGAVIAAGRRLMRFWLEATRLGLAFQPALGPLWLAAQTREADATTLEKRFAAEAMRQSHAFARQTGQDPHALLFIARLGYPKRYKAGARSIRRNLSELLLGGAVSTAVEKH